MSDRIAVMSKGRILQVGTPRQIYDQPADRFVASFIGESNLLSATLVTSSGDEATLKLAGGARLRAGGSAGLAPGMQISVIVRPEHAALVAAGQPDSLAGTVAEVVYFGTDTHFHVALDDGTRFVLRRQNSSQCAALPQTGDRVGVAIEDGAARVLADAR